MIAAAWLVQVAIAREPENATERAIFDAVEERMQYEADDPWRHTLGWAPGWADLHAHQMSLHAFDGRVVMPTPCDGTAHGLRADLEPFIGLVGAHEEVEQSRQSRAAKAGDPVLDDMKRHADISVTPEFDSWTHVQYSRASMRKANAEGLRFFTMSAVNNYVLCGVAEGLDEDLGSCADVPNLLRQLDAAWQFDGENSDWYHIALSPEGANHAMVAGETAVVLGVEASDLIADAKRGGMVTDRERRDTIEAYLRGERVDKHDSTLGAPAPWDESPDALDDTVMGWLGAVGVRQFQPIHEWDNWAGGASLHHVGLLQTGSWLMSHQQAGERLSVQALVLPLMQKIMQPNRIASWPMPGERAPDADGTYVRSISGLTVFGEALLERAINQYGMIPDLVHMSEDSIEDAVRVLGDRPFVASHSSWRATTIRSRTEWEYFYGEQIIREALKRDALLGLIPSGSRVRNVASGGPRNECHGSSYSFASSVAWGNQRGVKFTLGTDMNGGALMLYPSAASHQQSCSADTPHDQARSATIQELYGTQTMAAWKRRRALAEWGFSDVGASRGLIDQMRHLYEDQGCASCDPVTIRGSASHAIDIWFRVRAQSTSTSPSLTPPNPALTDTGPKALAGGQP